MACPFDVRVLIGRTFGSVLDEIAPGWGTWGFGPIESSISGTVGPLLPEEAVRANAETWGKAALMVAALREFTVVLVDIDGTTIPRSVWLVGRWWVYRRETEWLEALTAAGQRVVYHSPRFAAAVQPIAAERTGTVGRPTSKHLVKAECRRRYNEAGERHPARVGENAAEWGRILAAWLPGAYPTAAPMTPNRARNVVALLLRALEKGPPKIGA